MTEVLAQLKELAPAGVMPVTLIGWLTAGGLIISLILQFIAMGRFLEKLNGYGQRLSEAELETARRVEADAQQNLLLQKLQLGQEQLLKDITAATVRIEECADHDESLRREILGKLDKMSSDNAENSAQTRERLAALEQSARLTTRLREGGSAP